MHQAKVVPQANMVMGSSYRAMCKCGYYGRLYSMRDLGQDGALEQAKQDVKIHLRELGIIPPDWFAYIDSSQSLPEEERPWLAS